MVASSLLFSSTTRFPAIRSPRVMGGAAPGPGLRLIDQSVHRTVRTKSYGARNRPRETVGGFGPKFVSSRVSRPRLPALSRPNAPEPRRFRRVVSWTSVCRKAGGGGGSLERTRLRWKFPDNPQFTGKIRELTGNALQCASNYRMVSAGYRQIP